MFQLFIQINRFSPFKLATNILFIKLTSKQDGLELKSAKYRRHVKLSMIMSLISFQTLVKWSAIDKNLM